MTIREIYNLAINKGIEADFRGKEGVEKLLKRKMEKFEKMTLEQKESFDKDSLENPFSDSRILHIAQDKEIKRVLVGIDIEPAEILLAKEIGKFEEGSASSLVSSRDSAIDLIISHHPLGKGLANLHEVMEMQCGILSQYGVPINVAEGLMKERISEVARGVNGSNHQRTVDTAKLLGFNLMCLHTPCDNLMARFLKDKIEQANPERVEDLIKLLKEIPEYKEATKIGAGPKISSGSEENSCGKIAFTELTGGTEGSPKIYEKMVQAGIGTVVAMHISKEAKKEAETANINIIIAGHISSDSLGINLFLDELEKQGIEIVPCSGFTRISRLPHFSY
ncbi:MAG: NGG1p interacting factor NIF3 [Candidatus Nealsonbacteria bacterium]|nr:NGG1p interacting factor NIF3 [Candidatus Nealsonbacteria bacterium]